MADLNKRIIDECEAGEEGERGERGKRGKRGKRGHRGHDGERGESGERGHDGHDGHDGATGPTGGSGATGPTGSIGTTGATGPAGRGRCNCPCAECPDCPDVALVGCDAVKSPYFINVCCNCGPAINQPCICQPNTRDDGIQISIKDVGTCVIGTVVLVSGAFANTDYFLYQIDDLARRGYRVIAVTLRGNGDGDQPFGSISYDIWADDLRQVLDCLGVDDVTLVGHSAGAGTALHYVARHASCRVGRIVLAATAPLDPTFTIPEPALDAFIAALRTDYPLTLELLALTVGFAPSIPSTQTLQWFTRILLETNLYSAVDQLEYVFRTATDANVLLNDLPAVTVPTLILHAVGDLLTPFGIALQLNAGIPGSTLVPFGPLPPSGHLLHISEAQLFNDQVAAFASQGTCAMCPPDPTAPPAPQRTQAAPTLAPTTPESFAAASFPVAKRLVGWTSDGPVFES